MNLVIIMLDEVIRMKQAVKNASLSYMDLERLTGVSHSTLQRYLTGKTNRIPLSAVEKIAKATGVSAAWIMGWEDNEESPAEDEELNRLLKITDGLSNENIEKLIEYGYLLLTSQKSDEHPNK